MAPFDVSEHRWFPRHQPQTLQIAVALLYWNTFFGVLLGILGHGLDARFTLMLAIIEFVGAFGIANEHRWGYALALGGAVIALPLTLTHWFLGGGFFDLVFQLALVALLLHPQSRLYVKATYH